IPVSECPKRGGDNNTGAPTHILVPHGQRQVCYNRAPRLHAIRKQRRSVSKKSRRSDNLSDFLAPRYWPTWVGFGVIRVAAQFPFGLQIRIGQLLGWFSYHLARERRRICRINISLCFPDLSPKEQEKLV